MTRLQRIVVVLYCLLVVYCGVWVPWSYTRTIEGFSRSGIAEGYALIWNGPPRGYGTPDMAAVASRVLAATGLCAAAFLLARTWKAILSFVILAAVGFAGITPDDRLVQGRNERRMQAIHECAVSKVAMGCAPWALDGSFESCDRSHPDDVKTPEEAVRTAEGECTAAIDQQKSAGEQIGEYRRRHGVNPAATPQSEVVPATRPRPKKGLDAPRFEVVDGPQFEVVDGPSAPPIAPRVRSGGTQAQAQPAGGGDSKHQHGIK